MSRLTPGRARHSCHVQSLIILTAVLFMTGCFNTGFPLRPAEQPTSGNFGAHAQLPVVVYGPTEVVAADGSRADWMAEERGGIMPREWAILVPAVLLAANGVLGLEFGATDWLAIGPILSLQQAGGSLRFRLIDQNGGGPLSLALTTTAAYRPLIESNNVWLAGGFDLSHRWSSVVAATNFYASYGPESHALGLSSSQAERFDTGDDEGGYSTFHMTRDELRFHLAAGLGPAWNEQDLDASFLISIVGFAVAAAEEPDYMYCSSCQELEPFTLEEDFGVSLVLSVGMRGLD